MDEPADVEVRIRSRPSPADGVASQDLWRNLGKWAAGLALFLALLALQASLTLFQLTAEGPAKQTLRRATAALTEIDALVDRHYDEMQQSARASDPGDRVRLPDFPIDVPLTPDRVLAASRADLRNDILNQASDVLYREGTGALEADASHGGSVGRFTVGGLTDHGLGFLRKRNHTALFVVTLTLAVVSTLLAGVLSWLCRGFGRLSSVGVVVLLAAIPVAVGGIAARFWMRILAEGDTDYLEGEFLAIGRALAWIPIRNGLAFVVLGAAFLLLGWGGAIWNDRRARRIERPAVARRPEREPSV
jgi:uncharacterized membrane protein